MTSSESKTENTLGIFCGPAGSVRRWLVSWKLTLAIALVLGGALACAAFLESSKGIEYAQWYIDNRGWFVGLLAALAASIAAATLARRPWRWRHPVLVIVPVGALVLLAGFLWTVVQAIEGRLMLQKGAAVQAVSLVHRSKLTMMSPRGNGVQTTELGFSPGPVDWQSDAPLDFGEVDGIGVKVLQFYRYGRYAMEWVADASAQAPPAIQVAASEPQHPEPIQQWCVPSPLGTLRIPGQMSISFQQAPVSALRDDFLKPPALKAGTLGMLSAHYKDRVYAIPVDGNKGKKVPLGDSGASVEIVEYYATSRSSKDGFRSAGAEPKHPMLHLRVHVPGQTQPIQEIAYSNRPFVNYQTHGKHACPVKFWYHHPAAAVLPGAEFLQTPDGKIFCRVEVSGAYQSRGEVKPGDRIAIAAGREVSLLRHLPHARQQASFTSIDAAAGEANDAEAAALVELTAGDKTEQFWLRRNDGRLGVRQLQIAGLPRIVTFDYAKVPLGFSVKLLDFHREENPDAPGGVSCDSQLHMFQGDQESNVISSENPVRAMSTDSPLRYEDYTFSQWGVRRMPGGNADLSILRVTRNPGRFVKCAGGIMICSGLVLLCWLRCRARRPTSIS